ncbi:hypothetical protein BDV27DRAFT_125187 [Aspergillus caelatus]|uniref:Cytochrome b/b6 C-terminal region profile domain-containing protein n=1 Tax=Aspergillus caelatus TaxID=61420 RepID=A0A5N7A9U1_9EURO|nr:uncharacterized protein BDV27DRAFT_125187 [Aspergillus caelatus]KAE8366485.1 hypothetical protein BDV27DRAFT_125187 [Aspergillus caelatus]
MSRPPPGLVPGWIWFETTAIFRHPFLALRIGKLSNFSCFLAFFLALLILFVLVLWAAFL